MYQGASDDSECPLVVDDTTPTCGDSRFGCWTCTLVDQDKSMTAMIRNDEEKQWMRPLLKLRNELDDVSKESQTRDFRRMNGNVQLFGDRPIPGPYKQSAREDWLRKLLDAQAQVRRKAPEQVSDIELISMAELHEIRRIWVFDKHEVEDSLPQIYEDATGEKFPGSPLDEQLVLGAEEIGLLKEACEDDPIHFSMTRELLAVERQYRTMSRRAGLFEALEKAVKKGYYEDADDALQFAKKLEELRASDPTQMTLDEETTTDAPA